MPRDLYPNPNLPADEQIKVVRAFGEKAAKAAGMVAFTVVPHLFRIKEKDRGYYEWKAQYINRQNSGKRKLLRRENRYTLLVKEHPDDWQWYMNYSPHVHIDGYGFLKKVEKGSTSFQYRKNPKHFSTVEDLAAHFYYLFSHVSPVEGIQVITYHGEISYNQMVEIEKIKHREPVYCRCGAPMVYGDTKEPFARRKIERRFLLKSTGEISPVFGQQEIEVWMKESDPGGGCCERTGSRSCRSG